MGVDVCRSLAESRKVHWPERNSCVIGMPWPLFIFGRTCSSLFAIFVIMSPPPSKSSPVVPFAYIDNSRGYIGKMSILNDQIILKHFQTVLNTIYFGCIELDI